MITGSTELQRNANNKIKKSNLKMELLPTYGVLDMHPMNLHPFS